MIAMRKALKCDHVTILYNLFYSDFTVSTDLYTFTSLFWAIQLFSVVIGLWMNRKTFFSPF